MTRALRGRVRSRTSVRSRTGLPRAPMPSRPGHRRYQARQQKGVRHREEVVFDVQPSEQADGRARPPIVAILAFLERRCQFAEQSDGHLQRERALLLTFAWAIILIAGGLAAVAAALICIVIVVQDHRQDSLAAALSSLLALIPIVGSVVATAVSRRRRTRHS